MELKLLDVLENKVEVWREGKYQYFKYYPDTKSIWSITNQEILPESICNAFEEARKEALARMPKRYEFKSKLYVDGVVTARNQSPYGDDDCDNEFFLSTNHKQYLEMDADGFHDGQEVTVTITEVVE